MPNPLRSLSLVALLALLSATRVDAQTEVTVLPGEPLRLEVVGPASAPVGTHCSGRVTSVAQDTLLVIAGGNCARGSYLADLQVIRGDRGPRSEHVGLMALAGGTLGAILGRYTGKTTYSSSGQPNRGKMWTGLALGTLAGGAAGFALPAGPLWVRAGTPRPLRVIGGLNLTPGLEVALAQPDSH
jgi:hypothetical protein